MGPNLGGIEWWGYDDKISAFSRREGNGSVDLEVVLSPKTMAMLKIDTEFMQYESWTVWLVGYGKSVVYQIGLDLFIGVQSLDTGSDEFQFWECQR